MTVDRNSNKHAELQASAFTVQKLLNKLQLSLLDVNASRIYAHVNGSVTSCSRGKSIPVRRSL